MKIRLTSIMVDDQEKALKFYTDVLGFQKQYKWITVVSPEGPDDVQLALEPNATPAANTFQQAMFSQSIPLAAFEVDHIEKEYARLKALGVVFTRQPTWFGPVTLAVFSDTCGNLMQIYPPAH
jgi:catechol 2,3-dioxygenase-like lactoylglutathione lyase family enzyme